MSLIKGVYGVSIRVYYVCYVCTPTYELHIMYVCTYQMLLHVCVRMYIPDAFACVCTYVHTRCFCMCMYCINLYIVVYCNTYSPTVAYLRMYVMFAIS